MRSAADARAKTSRNLTIPLPSDSEASEASEADEDEEGEEDDDNEETPHPNRVRRNSYQRSDAARARAEARIDADIDNMLDGGSPGAYLEDDSDEDAEEVDDLL